MRIRLTTSHTPANGLKFNLAAGMTASGVIETNLPTAHTKEIESALNNLIPQHMQDMYRQLYLDERSIILKRKSLLLEWEQEVIPIVEQFRKDFANTYPELLI